MAIKKISDFTSGATLQPTDKVLVARGRTNVYVTGAAVPSARDFNPPYASMFVPGPYGAGATGPADCLDDDRGLILFDPSVEANGYKTVVRPIPSSMIGNFWFDAHIYFSGSSNAAPGGSGLVTAGICVTNNSTKTASVQRYLGQVNGNHGVCSEYFNGSSTTDGPYAQGEARWFRGVISGTVATLYCSEDGTNWNTVFAQDFGEPITHVGLISYNQNGFVGPMLCDYFDSGELTADQTIRANARSIPKPKGIGAAHRFWRLNVSQNWGSATFGFGNIQMRATPGGPNIAIGGSAIASGYNYYPASQSFAGQPSSSFPGWRCDRTSGWIGYRFPFPVKLAQITYQQIVNGGFSSTPRNMTIEFSDDAVTWTVARTLTDLPTAGMFGDFNTVLVNPTTVPVSTANPAAATTNLPSTGVRAAYSTRRLFASYNGPLFAISTAGSDTVDIFADASGYADLTKIMAYAGTGDAYIATWYDQSGNGFEANPLPQADLTQVRFAYRPWVVKGGVAVTTPDGKLAVEFAETPLDITNLNILRGSNIYAKIAFTKLTNYGPVISGLVTNGTAAGIGQKNDGSVVLLNDSGTLTTLASPLTVGQGYALYATIKLDAGTATGAAAVNTTTLGASSTLSYGSSLPATFTRIGAAAWLNRPTDGTNVLNARIGDLVIYDTNGPALSTITP